MLKAREGHALALTVKGLHTMINQIVTLQLKTDRWILVILKIQTPNFDP